MRYAVILNPFADHGRAGRRRADLERLLTEAGLSFAVWTTDGPGHAVTLAREAAPRFDAVVAVGGDGTVHETARGLIESGAPAALGVIPLGTGNDFVKMLGMPRRLPHAVAALARARPHPADYAWAEWDDGATRRAPFVNALGIGFDARVALEATRYKHWPGASGYLAAVLATLRCWPAPPVQTWADGAPFYDGPLLLVTTGNGISSGGAFYLTPRARIDDGRLDLCLAEAMGPARILRFIPRALRGRHEAEPEIHVARVTTFRLETLIGLPVHADGEILATHARRVTVQVVAGGLPVLRPP